MLAVFKLLIYLILFNSVELFKFEDAGTENITFGGTTSNAQILYMDENNVVPTTLVLITETTTEPKIGDFLDGNSDDLGASIEKDGDHYKIVLSKSVDYEAMSGTHRFLFWVQDGSAKQMINLNINNVDDNPPSISTTNCVIKENTTYTIDNAPCSFEVYDVDGFLDQMTFTIIPTDKHEDKIFMFAFNPTPESTVHTADVYLTLQDGQILDFEQIQLYIFTLEAKDSAGHSTVPNADISILVQVEDIPDENPIWVNYVTLRQFYEEQDETKFTVKARDGDFGIDAEINYKIDDPNNFATINKKTGDVVIGRVDRDAGYDTIGFTITAYEAQDVTSYVTQDLTFMVLDINDNIPKITIKDSDKKVIDIRIDENYFDKLPVSININDIDLGENALYTTTLVNEEKPIFTEPFAVIPSKGYQSFDFFIMVMDNKHLDYEDPPWRTITFTMEAVDVENATMSDSVDVTIHLNDVNDNYPVFDQDQYAVTVPENTSINTLIATVHATDKDEGDVVTHSFAGSSAKSILTIDATSGDITTIKERSFDYERQTEVIVQVQAEDLANHKTTAELTITVTDINDEPPVLSVSSATSIKENRKDGYEIPDLSITATDVDTTASLQFSIDWSESYATKNSIKINDTIFEEYHCIKVETIQDPTTNKKASAKLTITETVPDNTPDFEVFDTIFLMLQVTDLNTEEGESTVATTIVIKIENINDNPPVFSTEMVNMKRTVTENSEIGINVGTITATDADNLQELVYSIEGTDESTKDWITINSKTGELSVLSDKIDCDEPKRDSISYKISAFDGDFTTPAEITILINDQNDNSPVMKAIDTTVLELSAGGTVIYKLDATDNDRDESFRTVTYRFETDVADNIRDNIEIKKNTDGGYQLTVTETAQIIYTTESNSYQFNIICTDNPQNIGTRTNSVPVKVKITIEDINNNIPYVVTKEITGIRENAVKGDTVKDAVTGEDLDGPGYFSDIDFKITKIERYSDAEYNTDITNDLSQDLFSLTTDDKYESKKATLNINDDLKGLYGYYKLTVQTNDFDKNGQPENYKKDNIVKLVVGKYNFEAPTFVYPKSDDVVYLSNVQTVDTQLWLWNHRDKLPNIQATDNQNDKYDIKFTMQDENNIFDLLDGFGQSQAQLRLKNTNYEAQKKYTVELTANIDPTSSLTGNEASYTVSTTMTFQFIDLNSEPIFTDTEATIEFTEDEDGLKEKQTIPQADYHDNANIQRDIYYILLKEDDYKYFNVDQLTGTVTLASKLDYGETPTLQITIQSSNSDQINPKAADNTRLKVTVNVKDINNHPPVYQSDYYYGGIKSTYPLQTTILNLVATDADVLDSLIFKINTESMTKSDSSLDTVTNPFVLADKSRGVVELRLNFRVQKNMKGYFKFEVAVSDDRPPIHTVTTEVEVFIITADNVVNFKFENTLTQVQNKIEDVKTILSDYFEAECITETPTYDTTDGIQLNNQTIVPAYFINNKTKLIIDQADILAQVNDINLFLKLRNTFIEKGLVLMSFDSTVEPTENTEAELKAWLIGITICLGALCILLVVVFFLKTRSLNQRIKNLSTTKFGSQESGLNRQGIAVPTTNKHAVEGSNPVYNHEIDTKDVDRQSVRSGDSELIGVEELPEFNYYPEKHNGEVF